MKHKYKSSSQVSFQILRLSSDCLLDVFMAHSVCLCFFLPAVHPNPHEHRGLPVLCLQQMESPPIRSQWPESFHNPCFLTFPLIPTSNLSNTRWFPRWVCLSILVYFQAPIVSHLHCHTACGPQCPLWGPSSLLSNFSQRALSKIQINQSINRSLFLPPSPLPAPTPLA